MQQSRAPLKKKGVPWSISYGAGTSSGVTGQDDVEFAGVTAKKQIFGLAVQVSDDGISFIFDGILGLAFDSLNSMGKAPTLISTLINQHKIDPIFGIHLSHASNFDDQGTITLGGVDRSKFKGRITFSPLINNTGYWQTAADDIFVNGKPIGFSGKDAVFDTGTTFVTMPHADAAKVHKLIPGSIDIGSVFLIPCDTKAKVAFKFGGVKYNIPSRDLILLPTGGKNCNSSIIVLDQLGPNTWILGATFLKNVYSVHDVKNRRFGLAKQRSF